MFKPVVRRGKGGRLLPTTKIRRCRKKPDGSKKHTIYDDVVDKVTSSKSITPGTVRPLDGTLLKMFFVGMKVGEIAKKMNMQADDVRIKLNNPMVQRELKRLDKRAEAELVRIRVASEREFTLASLKAVRLLIDMMKKGKEESMIKSAFRILEYTHGKPTQKVAINAKITGEELSEDEENELEDGLEDDEEEGEK